MTTNLRLKRELVRLLPILLVAAAILYPDSGSKVVVYSLGISLLLAAVAHVWRRLVLPYIDLKEFSDKAKENPMASAVVFASVIYLIATFINASTLLLK
jgi:hypothetical protein